MTDTGQNRHADQGMHYAAECHENNAVECKAAWILADGRFTVGELGNNSKNQYRNINIGDATLLQIPDELLEVRYPR